MDKDTLATACQKIQTTLKDYGFEVDPLGALSFDVIIDKRMRVILRLGGRVEFFEGNEPIECDRLREYVMDALGDFNLTGEGANRRLVMAQPFTATSP